MKISIFVLIVCALVFIPGTAPQAFYQTADEWKENCSSDTEATLQKCVGYIAGMIDYHSFLQSLGTQPGIDFCIPDDAAIEDVSMQVLAYLESSPHNDAFIAVPGIAMALYALYPCQSIAKKP